MGRSSCFAPLDFLRRGSFSVCISWGDWGGVQGLRDAPWTAVCPSSPSSGEGQGRVDWSRIGQRRAEQSSAEQGRVEVGVEVVQSRRPWPIPSRSGPPAARRAHPILRAVATDRTGAAGTSTRPATAGRWARIITTWIRGSRGPTGTAGTRGDMDVAGRTCRVAIHRKSSQQTGHVTSSR